MRKFVIMLFGISFVIAASSAVTWAKEAVSVYHVPEDSSTAAENYWTVERMKNAIPVPTPTKAVISEPTPTSTSTGPATPGCDPSYDPVLEGADASASLNKTCSINSELQGINVSEGYTYPPPQTTFYVPSQLYGTTSTPFPYKAIGKVFFTGTNGLDYVCSGAAIGNSAVLTAGHCVSDGAGKYYSNWTFAPAYFDGNTPITPFGKWSASSFYTFSSYFKGKNMARDVAFAVVKKNSAGQTLAQKVGNLGFAYGNAYVQHWSMFGYSAEKPWTGEYMVDTEASYASSDTSETPNTPGIGTSQLGGCSGGPWIINLAPGSVFIPGQTSGNIANGVNSYSEEDKDLEIYTPYFDTDVKSLKDQAVAK
jgi:V8-like Glu-specific endopeptidase